MSSTRPRSGFYDGALYARTVEPLLRGLHDLVAGGVEDGARVLDACCGTGALARRLAARAERVVGVDLSPRMIRHAESVRRARALTNVEFWVADASRLDDVAEGAFDVATVVMGLHEMPAGPRARVLPELLRVARQVLVVDFVAGMPWNRAGLRNRALEIGAGPRHFAGFRDFTRRGGLDPLVRAAHAEVVSARVVDRGCLEILTLTRGDPKNPR